MLRHTPEMPWQLCVCWVCVSVCREDSHNTGLYPTTQSPAHRSRGSILTRLSEFRKKPRDNTL